MQVQILPTTCGHITQGNTMPDHTRNANDEATFYPVDGIRGHCECGHYFHYIGQEGETECEECGRVYNVYVDHERWNNE